MSLSCGILGLPNVGKSTFFNALSGVGRSAAENYPFCTIDPQRAQVPVPDLRLSCLAEVSGSKKILPALVEITDIAGLVKGASQGEGLGNQFLGHVRAVDALLHVIRCFEDDNVVHVAGRVDPVDDCETIETELLLADLESVTRRLPGVQKKAKQAPKEWASEAVLLEKVKGYLEDGRPLRSVSFDEADAALLPSLQLLTAKPMLYILNVPEGDVARGNALTAAMEAHLNGQPFLRVSAAIEEELGAVDEDDRADWLAALGVKEDSLQRLVRGAHSLLGLETFFTSGPQETRAWSYPAGLLAPQAAGLIHSDFERGFIAAEVCAVEDFLNEGGEAGARAAGKLRLQGRDYVMQDGDVVHFRFNV